jgi:hypothetical protein
MVEMELRLQRWGQVAHTSDRTRAAGSKVPRRWVQLQNLKQAYGTLQDLLFRKSTCIRDFFFFKNTV